jgi:hypothetical protein
MAFLVDTSLPHGTEPNIVCGNYIVFHSLGRQYPSVN